MTRGRWLLLAALLAAVALFFILDLDRFASLELLKAEQARFEAARRAAPWRTAVLYFLAYVAVTGLSLPGAAVMTLAVGALFGLFAGTLIVSFASTIGATLAFLASRYVFRDVVRARLRAYLDALSAVTGAEFAGWTRPRRIAFLLNAYNAFTVEKVLTRYPGLRSIRDFGRVFGNPWKDRFFRLLGRAESLDGIEQGLIRRPGAFDDPRIHFAANCASVGCPMLREEACVAERLDAQLEDQVRRFLSDRSRNRISGDVLELSRILDWYATDFAAGGGVTAWLASRAEWLSLTAAEQAALRAGPLKIAFLPCDWALNDAP